LRATASVGTSFRAPTYNELYYPGYGLATNKPEQGRNLEAGVRYKVAGAELQANYYRNRLTDMIVTVNPCPSRTGSCAYNVNHALLEGLSDVGASPGCAASTCAPASICRIRATRPPASSWPAARAAMPASRPPTRSASSTSAPNCRPRAAASTTRRMPIAWAATAC
jgi:hypothetical protein